MAESNNFLNTLKPNDDCGTAVKHLKYKQLTSQAVELGNVIYRYFSNNAINYAGSKYTLNRVNNSTKPSAIWLSLCCEFGEIHVCIGKVFLAAITEPLLCGTDLDDIEDELVLAVVEVACERWLTELEAEISTVVELSASAGVEPTPPPAGVDLTFSVGNGDLVNEELRIVCSASLVTPIVKLLLFFHKTCAPKKHREIASLSLRATLGTAELPHRDVENLGQGDVILITHSSCNDLSKVRLKIGASHFVIAEYHRSGFCITLSEEGNIMNEIPNGEKKVVPTDRFSAQLEFDIGSSEIPVEELSQLTEGYVLSLNRSTEAPVNIRCGARLVGRGELVDIDGKMLGVRIVELYGKSN